MWYSTCYSDNFWQHSKNQKTNPDVNRTLTHSHRHVLYFESFYFMQNIFILFPTHFLRMNYIIASNTLIRWILSQTLCSRSSIVSWKHFFQSLTQFLILSLVSGPCLVQTIEDGLVIGFQLLSLGEVTNCRFVVFQFLVKRNPDMQV